jgi:hypothetical protein
MVPVARASPKPAETLPMPVETCTMPTDKISAKKPLLEHSRSCRASGARPAGPLMRPHGKAFATGREERPISRLQHLGKPDRYTHRCSGATVGDNHEGPLKNRGESYLRHAKNKTKHTSSLTRNTHTRHGPRCSGPRGPPRRPSKTPARAHSSGLRLARGSTPPSSGLRLARGSLTSAHAPARGYEHLML